MITRGVPKVSLNTRHIWVAGPRGEWLEDRDGDAHVALFGDNERLFFDRDGPKIEGEIDGRIAVCWFDSLFALFDKAWEAFETAEPRLLERGVRVLAVATPKGKIHHIPLTD